MNERICHQFSDNHFREEVYLSPQRVLHDFVLGKLLHHEANKPLKSNSISTGDDLVETGSEF